MWLAIADTGSDPKGRTPPAARGLIEIPPPPEALQTKPGTTVDRGA
jgi:hypothetical protein